MGNHKIKNWFQANNHARPNLITFKVSSVLGSPTGAPRALTPSLSHHCVEGCRSPGRSGVLGDTTLVSQNWQGSQLLDRLQGKHPHFRVMGLLQGCLRDHEKTIWFLRRNCTPSITRWLLKQKHIILSLSLGWVWLYQCDLGAKAVPPYNLTTALYKEPLASRDFHRKGSEWTAQNFPSQTQTPTRRLCAQVSGMN